MQATLWHAACGMWHLLCFSSQAIDMGRCPWLLPVILRSTSSCLPVIHPKPQNFSLGKNSLNFKCDWLRFALLRCRCRCRCSSIGQRHVGHFNLHWYRVLVHVPAPCPMAIHDSLAAKSCCSLSFKFNSLCCYTRQQSCATRCQVRHIHSRQTHTRTHTLAYTLSNTCVSQGTTTINYFRACGWISTHQS